MKSSLLFSAGFSVLDISQTTFPSSVPVIRTEILSFFGFTCGSPKKTQNFSAHHCHLRWEKSFGKCLAQKTQQKTTVRVSILTRYRFFANPDPKISIFSCVSDFKASHKMCNSISFTANYVLSDKFRFFSPRENSGEGKIKPIPKYLRESQIGTHFRR